MPNPHAIYLHDTPSQALFGRAVRAFSHGCIRTQNVRDFAALLLAPTGDWSRGQIDAALGMAFIAYHLIQFTREALRGEQNASYYSTKARTAEPMHSPQLAALRKSA